jgi:hypothetical protein
MNLCQIGGVSCSDAAGADFSGSSFFGVIQSTDPAQRIAAFPDFFKTDIRGAKLSTPISQQLRRDRR